MNGQKTCLDFGIKQPTSRECNTRDYIFLKEMYLPKADMVVPQHVHHFGHTTLVVRGRIRAFVEASFIGDFGPMEQIWIEAGKPHYLISLEDETLALCLHRMHTSGEPNHSKVAPHSVPETVLKQHAAFSA